MKEFHEEGEEVMTWNWRQGVGEPYHLRILQDDCSSRERVKIKSPG
jgi:hypothetical protein